jgi:hypothetical protein
LGSNHIVFQSSLLLVWEGLVVEQELELEWVGIQVPVYIQDNLFHKN